MCGRFALSGTPEEIRERFHTNNDPPLFSPHYNIAPGSMIPIINHNHEAVLARWGLIPSWAKDPKIGYRTINARAETLSEKPVFRSPFLKQRCLIPASGFYEWKVIDKEKVPYYVHIKNTHLFAFAGLYDEWKDAEGYPILTCTIITVTPNEVVKPIHDRMPAIFASESTENQWLNPQLHDPVQLSQMLQPFDSTKMEAYPITKGINNPDNDSREILSPALADP